MPASFRWDEPNLEPTKTKRQHYVPRFYLRSFVGKNGKLRVIDLNEANREFRTSVENAAAESRFYDIEVNGARLSTEDWLSEVEGDAAEVLRKLVDSPNSITTLSDDEELLVARFLVALRFRVPAFRASVANLHDNMTKQMQEFAWEISVRHLGKAEAQERWNQWKEHPDGWWLRESTPATVSDVVTYMLGETQGYANLLRAMSWRIGEVPDGAKMCTSDCPMGGFLSPAQAAKHNSGFSGFQYFVPLSPEVLLKIMPWDDSSTTGQPRGTRAKRDFSSWEALFARNVQILDATRYLFGDGPIATREHAVEHVSRVEASIMEVGRWLGVMPGASKWGPG
jgi:hypothetical protein